MEEICEAIDASPSSAADATVSTLENEATSLRAKLRQLSETRPALRVHVMFFLALRYTHAPLAASPSASEHAVWALRAARMMTFINFLNAGVDTEDPASNGRVGEVSPSIIKLLQDVKQLHEDAAQQLS
mmetsp:Transcript_16187/g.50202  ORF Transcript_16187/g.50202 Transcript_16187/m.50202 type:complete len:129 (+) Transcript_16187:1650-2036(+)